MKKMIDRLVENLVQTIIIITAGVFLVILAIIVY